MEKEAKRESRSLDGVKLSPEIVQILQDVKLIKLQMSYATRKSKELFAKETWKFASLNQAKRNNASGPTNEPGRVKKGF